MRYKNYSIEKEERRERSDEEYRDVLESQMKFDKVEDASKKSEIAKKKTAKIPSKSHAATMASIQDKL